MVLPVNGTREALFAFVQAVVEPADPADARGRDAESVLPDLRRRGAARRRASPCSSTPTAATASSRTSTRVPAEIWKRCELLFLCWPGNPTGAVMSLEFLRHALELAERYDFVIASDECYAEMYRDEAHSAAVAAAGGARRLAARFVRALRGVPLACPSARACPGLRSGFVAGDAGADQALPAVSHLSRLRHAGAHAARQHRGLERRRARGREPRAVPREIRARAADPRSRCSTWCCRTARFYLWPDVRGDDEAFARDLFATQNVTVLPGSYLARDTRAGNPGRQRVRISLVAPVEECVTAAQRIRTFLARQTRSDSMTATLSPPPSTPPSSAAPTSPRRIRPPALRHAVEQCIELLDSGQARVAEKKRGQWTVNQWIKKAVLLSFRLHDNADHATPATRASSTRCRPSSPHLRRGQLARRPACASCRPPSRAAAAYIAKNVVLMPSYVNIGAYVDEGTMVDTWATVGSCAQIGKNVHLSGGVGIGGVLEPLQANPTIIEDNCFIGARSEVVEGVIVEENSVISMGVYIGQSTKIYDRATGDSAATAACRPAPWWCPGNLPSRRRQVQPVLRGDRQARRRADARQDLHQRAAARGLN